MLISFEDEIIVKLRKRKGKNKISENNIEDKIEVLKKYFTEEEIRKFAKNPEIFTLDKHTLESRIAYYVANFGKDFILKAPSLLTYPPSTVEKKIEDLTKYFRRSRTEIISLILNFPKILTYDLSTIDEKVKIINKGLNIPIDYVKVFVYENPRVLSRGKEHVEYVIRKCGDLALRKPSLFYKSRSYISKVCG